jgi:hypothetical protein
MTANPSSARRRAALLAAGCALALGAAGCGSVYKQPVANAAATRGGDGTNAPSMFDPDRASVTIGADGFHPQHLHVPTNTSVRWVNRAGARERVVWTGGAGEHFASPPLPPGSSYLIRMPQPSRVTYRSGDGAFDGTIAVGSPTPR